MRGPEHQRVARGDQPAQGPPVQGRERRSRGHWQQGSGLPQPDWRQGGVQRDGPGRHAPPRQADRPGQGAARCLYRRPDQRGLRLLHQVHQHDEAGVGDRTAAAAQREHVAGRRRRPRLGLHL